MKKVWVLGGFFLAQAVFGQKIEPSAGLFLGYNHAWNFEVENGTVASQTYRREVSGGPRYLQIGAFLDLTYLDISLDFGFSFGDNTIDTTTELGTNKTKVTNFRKDGFTAFTLAVHGKYPLQGGRDWVWFPYLGLAYSLNLAFSNPDLDINKDDLSEQQKIELNELFIEGGIGGEYALSNTVYLRPVFTAGYNLLAATESGKNSAEASGYTYFEGGIKLGGSIGLGFRF